MLNSIYRDYISFLLAYQSLQQKIITRYSNLMSRHHDKKSSKPQNSISIKGKLGSFRQTTRQNYIESTINAMREQLLVAQNKDYHTLKKINLQECFNSIDTMQDIRGEFKKLDQTILSMFAYCVASSSSHMYFIMSDFTLQKLIKLIEWKNIGYYEMKPRLYVRIHRIIANYCNYALSAPQIYFDVIGEILKNILKQPRFYEQSLNCQFFSHTQAKELISVVFQGLGQIDFEKIKYQGFFVDRCGDLINAILNETTKVFNSLKKHRYDESNKGTAILAACFKIFQNFLALEIPHSLDSPSESPQFKKCKMIESLDIEIIDRLLLMLKQLNNNNNQQQFLIAKCLVSFTRNNLQQRPQILLKHDFRIMLDCFRESVSKVKQIHQQITNYYKRLQIEGENQVSMIHLRGIMTDYQKLLLQWLGILVRVFGVNLPEDESDGQQEQNAQRTNNTQICKLEQAYYEIWIDWLQNYIIPAFKDILRIQQLGHKEIIANIMNILQNICLDQALCEILLEQPALSNFIFYNCMSLEVKLDIKKKSLMCLINMLRVAYGDNLRKILQAQAKKYEFPTIFADNVGAYSSPQTNERILQGLCRLFELYPCQQRNNNYFWRLFCEAGGKRQLQKILDFKEQNWQNAVKLAAGILQQYDIDEV